MSTYAARTEVSSEKSRLEIERTLKRYGATSFAYGWKADRADIAFEIANRRVLFHLPLPDPNEDHFRLTPSRRDQRTPEAREREYEQAVRQRWRALALIIKAKLEAIEAGIVTLEEEFLAHVLLPNGQTVGEWAAPQLELAYERGEVPALMPAER